MFSKLCKTACFYMFHVTSTGLYFSSNSHTGLTLYVHILNRYGLYNIILEINLPWEAHFGLAVLKGLETVEGNVQGEQPSPATQLAAVNWSFILDPEHLFPLFLIKKWYPCHDWAYTWWLLKPTLIYTDIHLLNESLTTVLSVSCARYIICRLVLMGL